MTGSLPPPDPARPHPVRFLRSRSERVIAGICGALGIYLGVDPVLVRIAAVVLGFVTGGAAVVVYVVAWVLVPEDDGTVRYTGDRPVGGDHARFVIGAILVIVGVIWSLGVLLPGLLEVRVLGPLLLIGAGAVLLLQGARR